MTGFLDQTVKDYLLKNVSMARLRSTIADEVDAT
jgi:hypothetical protein